VFGLLDEITFGLWGKQHAKKLRCGSHGGLENKCLNQSSATSKSLVEKTPCWKKLELIANEGRKLSNLSPKDKPNPSA
jgi:hypothetical protein